MEHAEIRTVLGQHISSLIAQPGDLPLTLRPYQAETLESTARWLSDPLGTKRAYVNHATGLGKTVLFASMVAAASGMRSLVVVPTKTLLEQTARVIAKFTGGMLGHQSSLANIQDYDGETVAVRGMNHSAVVLTTDASFNKFAVKIRQEFDPHLIIRDECHWGYIGPALAALEQFPEAVIVGFSATPDYLTNTPKGGYVPVKLENGQTLYGPLDRFADTHFQTCLDRRSVRWGIESGWLCPLAWGMIEFDMSLKSIPVVDGPNGPDYDEAKLQELMSKHWSVMCETIRRLYDTSDYDLGKRQAYAICPSVEAAETLARIVGSLGISTACVTGNTPDTERNILLQAFNDSEIGLLTSVMVLREGWDAPDAEVCMMLRPTKSRVLYEQGIGRALRLPKNNGLKVALILDAHFQSSKFAPLSAPAIFGKPGEEIPIGGMLIGGNGGMRGGEGIESPYLPKDAEPRLVVIDVYDDEAMRQNRACPDGTFEAEGKTWMAVDKIAKMLGTSRQAILRRTESLACLQGIGCKGHPAVFYVFEDVVAVCADLIEDLPSPGKGLVEIDGEHWGSIESCARVIGVGRQQITNRVKKNPLSTRRGRDATRKIVAFYSLEEILRTFPDLSKAVPQAEADGFVEADGERWAPLTLISMQLGIDRDAIVTRLLNQSVKTKEAKDRVGRITEFYPLSTIEQLCSGLLENLPLADEHGFFEADGERWGTIKAIAKAISFDRTEVMRRVGEATVRSRRGKNASGRVCLFYPIPEVEHLCIDRLETLPRADEHGFFEADGRRWGLVKSIAAEVDVSHNGLRERLLTSSVPHREGFLRGGQRCVFYVADEAVKLVSHLTEDIPKADQTGTFTEGGMVWANTGAIARRFSIKYRVVNDLVLKLKPSQKDGKCISGRRVPFYALSPEFERALGERAEKRLHHKPANEELRS